MLKAKRREWIVGLVVLMISILSFVYWGNRKEIWFCDEIYTFESSNGFEQEWPAELVDVWQTGEQVEAYFAADSDSLSLESISNRLYNDHVPLYFWIFRIVSFYFFPGSGSIWIGLSINLVFYIPLVLLVYKVFSNLTKSPIFAGVTTLLTCVVNRVMLEQAITLRMYMMLLVFQVLILFCQFMVLKRVYEQKKLSPLLFVGMYVASVAGFLTHYDYWIFYAVTMFVSCAWLLILAIKNSGKQFWKSGEFRTVLWNVSNFVLALLSTIWIFPYCRWNLNRGKGQMALHSIFDFSAEKIKKIAWGYERLVKSVWGELLPVWLGLLLILICLVSGVVILWRRGEKHILTAYAVTVLVTQIYQLAVCFTLPDGWEERYLWGSFSIFWWCVIYGFYLSAQQLFLLVKQENRRKLTVGIVGAAAAILFFAGQVAVIDDGAGVAYLFHPNKDRQALEENAEIPWIVYGAGADVYSYYDWMIPQEICFLTMDNTETDANALLEIADEDEIILYVYAEYHDEAVTFFEQALNRTIESEIVTTSTNMTVYKLYMAE